MDNLCNISEKNSCIIFFHFIQRKPGVVHLIGFCITGSRIGIFDGFLVKSDRSTQIMDGFQQRSPSSAFLSRKSKQNSKFLPCESSFLRGPFAAVSPPTLGLVIEEFQPLGTHFRNFANTLFRTSSPYSRVIS